MDAEKWNVIVAGTGTGKSTWATTVLPTWYPDIQLWEMAIVTSRNIARDQIAKAAGAAVFRPYDSWLLELWDGAGSTGETLPQTNTADAYLKESDQAFHEYIRTRIPNAWLHSISHLLENGENRIRFFHAGSDTNRFCDWIDRTWRIPDGADKCAQEAGFIYKADHGQFVEMAADCRMLCGYRSSFTFPKARKLLTELGYSLVRKKVKRRKKQSTVWIISGRDLSRNRYQPAYPREDPLGIIRDEKDIKNASIGNNMEKRRRIGWR